MTQLTNLTKHLILGLHINASRYTVLLVERIARVLHIDVGEREDHEYVQLMHTRTINKEKASAQ